MSLRLSVAVFVTVVAVVTLHNSVCVAEEFEVNDNQIHNDNDKRDYLRVMKSIPAKKDYLRVMRSLSLIHI